MNQDYYFRASYISPHNLVRILEKYFKSTKSSASSYLNLFSDCLGLFDSVTYPISIVRRGGIDLDSFIRVFQSCRLWSSDYVDTLMVEA